MQRTTLLDIARAVGTSTATVSRVLSNSSYPVSETLRRRIQETAAQLDYLPNQAGRQLKTRQSREIGVIVPSITNPFYARLLLGIEVEARKHDYHVLFCDSFRDSKTERACIRTLLEKQVAGLVISSISDDARFLENAQRHGLEIVAIDQNIDSNQFHRVGFNFFKAGLMAVDYLVSLGLRDLVFASTPLKRRSRREQLDGFRTGLLRQQIEWSDRRLLLAEAEQEQESMLYEFSAGQALAEHILSLKTLPQAIVAVNDLVAISLMQALAVAGLVIPDDLSIIGFDNLELAQMVTPALTTIDQPALDMGRIACQILISKAADVSRRATAQRRTTALTLEPRLVVRHSTRQPPAACQD